MTVYVDPLMPHGFRLRGKPMDTCHMFSDQIDLAELHELAGKIGMRRAWLHRSSILHYDLISWKRLEAVRAGAVEVDSHEAVRLWRLIRGLMNEAFYNK